MHPQGDSIWGNINLCIEIALNIYYIYGEHGEGIAIPKEHAKENFSDKTVVAGKELEGYLYYTKGETMDMPLYEMMQKRAAMARKMELAAAMQMEAIRERGQKAVSVLFADMKPLEHTGESLKQIREGIYLKGGEKAEFLVHEKVAEHFLSPYACEFGRNENGFIHYTLQSSAIPLHELKEIFPECREMIVSEESLYATLCTHYPAYREEYNAIVSKDEQIPQISAPENLFLQEQLDRGRTGVAEENAHEEALAEEEADEDEYGEQVEYGFEA